MAARKHDRPVIGRAKASDDAIGAGADVSWLLAVRAAIPEQEPAGTVRENLAALATFVVAVIPFEEIGIEFGDAAESGELTGAPRALKRARDDPAKRYAFEALLKPLRLAFAFLRQRDVGAAGVLAACAPFGFAMADEGDARQHDGSNPGLRLRATLTRIAQPERHRHASTLVPSNRRRRRAGSARETAPLRDASRSKRKSRRRDTNARSKARCAGSRFGAGSMGARPQPI